MVKKDIPSYLLMKIDATMERPHLITASNKLDKIYDRMIEHQITDPRADYVVYEPIRKRRWD